jgi:hypothetical protein
MQPDQRAGRPLPAGDAEPLGPAGRVLLAAAAPGREMALDQLGAERRERGVERDRRAPDGGVAGRFVGLVGQRRRAQAERAWTAPAR